MASTTLPHLSILYDVHRISRFVQELMEDALVDQPITGPEFALYSWLRVTGPTTVSDVAAGIATPLATTSKLLDRLERQGHVAKSENPEDRRSTLVELTDAGLAVHTAAGRDFGKALKSLQSALGSARDDVIWALVRLDHALRVVLSGPQDDSPRDPASTRSVSYGGPPLTAEEEDEVRAHIDYLLWKRNAS